MVIIDEPELGLHPHAITLLAGMVHSASAHSQILLATQSSLLVDQFEPKDVIVVDRTKNEDDIYKSTFKRLERAQLEHWLEDYSLGEMWNKNLIGGRPAR